MKKSSSPISKGWSWGRWIISACLLAGACRGTIPELREPPGRGVAGVLLGLKISSELAGEVSSGALALGLEGEPEGQGEIYRLPLEPGGSRLYQVEPGLYRLAPERSLFGARLAAVRISAQGRRYEIPVPREILRHESLSLEPGEILVLGRIEVSIAENQDAVRVRLNESPAARRDMVQDMIRKIMDPNQPLPARESALSWVQALERALRRLYAEKG